MKKILSFVLALMMALSLCPLALANDTDDMFGQIKKVVTENGQYDPANRTYTLSKILSHTKITEPERMNDDTTYIADEDTYTESIIYSQASGELTFRYKYHSDYVLRKDKTGETDSWWIDDVAELYVPKIANEYKYCYDSYSSLTPNPLNLVYGGKLEATVVANELDRFASEDDFFKNVEMTYRGSWYFAESGAETKLCALLEALPEMLAEYGITFTYQSLGFAKYAPSQTHDVVEDFSELTIRANGKRVDFPDTQPYINADGRTMIPVRMAAEALGATVSWDAQANAAVIEKNGVEVRVPIGEDTLSVKKDDASSTVKMDTKAENKDGRTCVPIRFVAEALGAYIDYSADFNTVGIYQDVLTAEQIEKLRGYGYPSADYGEKYEGYLEKNGEKDTISRFGKNHRFYPSFADSFETAHEYCYRTDIGLDERSKLQFPRQGISVSYCHRDEFIKAFVDEIAAAIHYSSRYKDITFVADPSCVYQVDGPDYYMAVRGYVYVKYKTAGPETFSNRTRDIQYMVIENINGGKVGQTEIFPIEVCVFTKQPLKIDSVCGGVVRLDDSIRISNEAE